MFILGDVLTIVFSWGLIGFGFVATFILSVWTSWLTSCFNCFGWDILLIVENLLLPLCYNLSSLLEFDFFPFVEEM